MEKTKGEAEEEKEMVVEGGGGCTSSYLPSNDSPEFRPGGIDITVGENGLCYTGLESDQSVLFL